MKLIFRLLINVEGFFKVILSFQVYVARHAHITQNNKFAISLQHHKNEVSDTANFFHADKHVSLIHIDTIILMEMVKYSRSSQNSKFGVSLHYLKKEVRNEVDFLYADKHQSFLHVDFNTLDIKFFYKEILSVLMGMIQHFESTQTNKFAISLQDLKKEVRNEVHFLHADKQQNFYKLALSF